MTQTKILVIGDLMIDSYLWGNCSRISPESPVPIINIDNENSLLGGAGNVVNNLLALGSKVDIISVIGDCENTNKIKEIFLKKKINTKYLIKEKQRLTTKKTRIIASQQQVMRFDKENTNDISADSEQKILNIFNKLVKNYNCVILSDYGKGVLTNNLTKSLISIANKNDIKVLVDPKGYDYKKYYGSYLLTPNIAEASLMTGVKVDDKDSIEKAIIKLKNEINLTISLITLSEKGIAIFDDNLRIHPTKAREVFDVTGAGDTVIASLAIQLSQNKKIDEAVEFANIAAGIVVGKIGSSTTTIDEINNYSHTNDIKNFDNIQSIVANLKKQNKKIIFTNGCFDILHLGHIKYLQQAKSYGDILIVGINSDNSIKRLKGKTRPINTEYDRAYLVKSLDVVDFVVIFNEDTPIELIKIIKPDVLIKGGDYKNKEIIGEDIATELRLVDFIAGKSTSLIINKIKQ